MLRWNGWMSEKVLGVATLLLLVCPAAQGEGRARLDLDGVFKAVGGGTQARLRGVPRAGVPLRLRLAVADSRMTLDLEPYSVRAADFFVELRGAGGKVRRVAPGPVPTFRGAIREIPGSRVLGVVLDGGLEASIEIPGREVLWLEPEALRPEVERSYRLSPCGAERHVAGGRALCGLRDRGKGKSVPEDLSSLFSPSTGEGCAALGGCLADIVFEVDSAAYTGHGSSSVQVQAAVQGLMVFTVPRFQEFQITHRLLGVVIRTDPATDPYADPAITTINEALATMATVWLPGSTDADLVHLLSEKPLTGAAGLANIGGVCSPTRKFGVSLGLSASCARAQTLIHELGHNWGANHTVDGMMQQFNTGDCSASWTGSSLTEIPTTRDLVDGTCLELAAPPVPRFAFSCAQLACAFDASASTVSSGPATYAWSFGDANTGATEAPSHSYAATGAYTVTLTVTDAGGLSASSSRKVSVVAGAPVAGERYFTLPPCRVADTRNTTILSSGQTRLFTVAGSCGVPTTAKAVSFNLTAISPSGDGFLSVYPGDQPANPFTVSVLNFSPAAQPRGNNAILRLATDGSGTIAVVPAVVPAPGAAEGQVHLTVDVTGYFSEDATAPAGVQGPLGFQSLTPCRLVDTRSAGSGGPLLHGGARSFPVQGVCGVPSGAVAAALNLITVTPTTGGFATLYPAGSPIPGVSSINFASGTIALANGARSGLGTASSDLGVVFYGGVAGSSMDAAIDVSGYFKGDAPLRFHPTTPCRLADTRFAEQGGPAPLAAGETRAFQVRGNCGIPTGARAGLLNLVAVGPGADGYLTAFAAGGAAPLASTLNYGPGQGTLANGAIVPLSTTLANDLSILSGGATTHVLVDVYGYFD